MTFGITCPSCGSSDTGVLDSRVNAIGLRRRSKCVCSHRFMTQEIVVSGEPVVVTAGTPGRSPTCTALGAFLRRLDSEVRAGVTASIDRLAISFWENE